MRDIVAEIRSGDKSSFKELFEDYYPILFVFASKYVKDDELCKDIAQETLLSYWEKRKSFEDIYKAAENCSQDQFGTIIRQNIIKNQNSLKDGATEYVLPIYAMQRFVKLDHQKSIMAVLSKGPLNMKLKIIKKFV